MAPCELSAFDLGSVLVHAGAGGLCERVQRLLEGADGDVVVCDVARVRAPDITTVAALARVSLTARRFGRTLRLCHPPPALVELVELAGLADVVLLGVEPLGQAEEGEEPVGVEERGHRGDLAG